MNGTVALMISVILTSVTGGLLTLVWYGIGRYLEAAGFLNILYKFLKVVNFFWYFPLAFLVLLFVNAHSGQWGGILFVRTPIVQEFSIYFCIIWLTGVVIGLVKYVRANLKILKVFFNSFPCEVYKHRVFDSVCKELHISRRRVRLKQTYCVETPFIAGFLWYTVYLPAEGKCSDETLRVIFLHELTHYSQGDVRLKRYVLLAQKLHFFNPLSYWFADLVERWSEYSCDYTVCKMVGGFEPYFEAVLEMVLHRKIKLNPASHMAEDKHSLLERAERMSKMLRKEAKPGSVAVLIVLCMVVVSTVSVAAASVGTAGLYSILYKATSQEEIEEVEKGDAAEAAVDTESDDGYVSETGECVESGNGNIYILDWEVDGGCLMTSLGVEANSGEVLGLCVTIEDAKTNVAVGIIGPDGEKRCINSREGRSHEFALDQAGAYRIYVRNQSDETVHVSGLAVIER